MLYVLELTEHAEEGLMKRLQSAVSEGEPLDLVQIRAKHERKDMGKAWSMLAVLFKYDGMDRCEAIADGRVNARGAGKHVQLAGTTQQDFLVRRMEEIRAPRNADKRASVQCLNLMTCIVQYLRHHFGKKAVGAGEQERPWHHVVKSDASYASWGVVWSIEPDKDGGHER